MRIDVKLLGKPQIKINDNKIKISLKKSEAMFYYLLMNKKCSKTELTNLFWGNKNDNSAKRNLRVNIHRLKRDFNDYDILLSTRYFILLNPEAKINLDIDEFIKDSNSSVNHYKGELLEDFYLKGTYDFEDWLYKERLNFKELYIKKLYNILEHSKANNKSNITEKICREIISQDIYDEKAYRILMEYYSKNDNINKSIELFNDLTSILNKELNIGPSKTTRDLFNKIMINNRYKSKKLENKENKIFFGREKELLFLNNQLLFHLEDKKTNPIVIYGESGIGKSYLIEKFLSNVRIENASILKANCYQEESELFLKPWYEIAIKILDISEKENFEISDYSKNIISNIFTEFKTSKINKKSENIDERIFYNNALREFINLFSKLVKERKIILVFEDIQWMDQESFRILSNILKDQKNILTIFSCRNIRSKSTYDFIGLLEKYINFNLIQLSRFSKEETKKIIKLKLNKSKVNKIDHEIVFNESEGNPFFLTHIISNINNDSNEIVNLNVIKNNLQSRLIGLSEAAEKLLKIISIFYNEVDFEILTKMMNKTEIEMFDLIDELENKNLISEDTILSKLYIKISHNKLREFLYNEQPEWKRTILHNKAAKLIENIDMKTDYNYYRYSKLIYHYKNSKNMKSELKYTILYLESIIYLKHEFNYDGVFLNSSSSQIIKDEILSLFNKIKKILKTIDNNDYTEEIKRLEMIYLYILGRFYVMGGEYDKCIKNINILLEKAQNYHSEEYLIKGYKIMIFYGIEIHDPTIIKNYVEKGLNLLNENNYIREKYLFTRYLALYQLMKGMYKESHENFQISMDLIQSIKNKQSLDYIEIARNYYYFGELNRKQKKFKKAISYFNKATDACIKNNLGEGLAQFKVKVGQILFDKGDFINAKKYLESSIKIYDNYGTSWNRTFAEGYLSLIYLYEKKYTKSLRSLKRADRYYNIYENLYEKGLLNKIKAEITRNMEGNKKIHDIFKDYLNKDFNYYYNISYKSLYEISNCYEIESLEKLKKL